MLRLKGKDKHGKWVEFDPLHVVWLAERGWVVEPASGGSFIIDPATIQPSNEANREHVHEADFANIHAADDQRKAMLEELENRAWPEIDKRDYWLVDNRPVITKADALDVIVSLIRELEAKL